MFDNSGRFSLDVAGRGTESLGRTVDLLFAALNLVGTYPDGARRGVTHYRVAPADAAHTGVDAPLAPPPRPQHLIFYNNRVSNKAADGRVALPFVLDAPGVADFARRWLEVAAFPQEPNIDGDVKRGWRLMAGDADRRPGSNSVLTVLPYWVEYHK